jgi:hypothetical protein
MMIGALDAEISPFVFGRISARGVSQNYMEFHTGAQILEMLLSACEYIICSGQ